MRLDLAGRDLTDCMMTLLTERGSFPYRGGSNGREIARRARRAIKEAVGYVSLDYEADLVSQITDVI